ncbi:MAG: archaeosortase/exosortase family protein [Candidatus Nanohaloarchaea archaeon]
MAGTVLHLILWIYPDTTPLQAGLASIISRLLSVAGIENYLDGISVVVGNIRYVITQDCLGWKSMAAFAGLMYASGTLRDNLETLFYGALIIEIANIVRVFTTVYLAHNGIISFEIIHGIMWKWGLTALVLLMWYAWFTHDIRSELESAVQELGSELEKYKD